MKRHEALIPLSRFHRSVLFLALIAKKNAPPVKGYPTALDEKIQYALDFYARRLKPHFQLEEEKLFPFIKKQDEELDRLLEEIIQEREELDVLFEKLRDSNDPEKDLDTLGIALEKHIRKEERVFFERIQEVIPEGILTQVGF